MAKPDGLIREIPLIQRYARHNEADDYKFRTHLKGGLDLSNEALDKSVQEITEAIWKQIDCTQCANCCKTLQIVVDQKDIARLATRLQTTPAKFTRQYVQKAEDGTLHFGTPPCPFLGVDNRCTVYEDRPQACHDFPYLHTAGFRQRSLMMIENTAVCPIVFNVWQAVKARFRKRR